jgi:hypothetical protein
LVEFPDATTIVEIIFGDPGILVIVESFPLDEVLAFSLDGTDIKDLLDSVELLLRGCLVEVFGVGLVDLLHLVWRTWAKKDVVVAEVLEDEISVVGDADDLIGAEVRSFELTQPTSLGEIIGMEAGNDIIDLEGGVFEETMFGIPVIGSFLLHEFHSLGEGREGVFLGVGQEFFPLDEIDLLVAWRFGKGREERRKMRLSIEHEGKGRR